MSNVKKLLQSMNSAKKPSDLSAPEFESYLWFRDKETEELIAFNKNGLSPNELSLLSMLLNPSSPPPSGKADEWLNFLRDDSGNCPLPKGSSFRMVQFSSNAALVQDADEAPLDYVFSEQAVIVLKNENSGFVIEPQSSDTLSLEELASASQAIENDLEINITFFAGSFHTVNAETRSMLLMEMDWFEQHTFHDHRQPVLSLFDVMPINLINRFSDFEKNTLFSAIFELFETEQDLPRIIQTFVENLSNVSSTAKMLYMHRNSLQYRLDKFTEKTSIDLKTFYGGLIAYFACLEWNQRNG
ncbi:helix-turn-helix domain-containing protein [Jeotgalibacillus aurantiacus]|uniref:helix-turn-helix domain-containing protein n=1 Tax=Jeotgalibacillus aurantiacus TaxID=2763266 RepID=UPI001D0AE8F5|nr:helix-turn-helix domain-containing protein [Jeotgalibacillus aurantiacus]